MCVHETCSATFLSHIMHELIGLERSTPPQNRQLIANQPARESLLQRGFRVRLSKQGAGEPTLRIGNPSLLGPERDGVLCQIR